MRVECEGKVKEELLRSLNLPDRTTSFETFNALDGFFLELNSAEEMYWHIHGAANMIGHCSGVVAKEKNFSHPDILSTHCVTHLVAKIFPRTARSIKRCY